MINNTSELTSVNILGVKVHNVDMETTLALARKWVNEDTPRYIVTADSFGIFIAQEDKEFMDIINSADLVTPDSTGILVGTKILGTPIRERVSGCDIAAQMCAIAAQDGFSVYLFGAKPGIAELAAEHLTANFPGLKIAGTRNGFFTEDETPEIVKNIKESGARLLLVAFGIPSQEKWIKKHLAETGVGVAMGVGGTLDVMSGYIKRAPLWMQKRGLEWLYRLSKDPRKINKVAILPKFLYLVFMDKYFRRKK